MLKNKKGVELPINMVILAVVGLIVLVVIVAIVINVSNRTSNTFGSGSEESCKARGGECLNTDIKKCDGAMIPYDCPNEDDVCCIPIEME